MANPKKSTDEGCNEFLTDPYWIDTHRTRIRMLEEDDPGRLSKNGRGGLSRDILPQEVMAEVPSYLSDDRNGRLPSNSPVRPELMAKDKCIHELDDNTILGNSCVSDPKTDRSSDSDSDASVEQYGILGVKDCENTKMPLYYSKANLKKAREEFTLESHESETDPTYLRGCGTASLHCRSLENPIPHRETIKLLTDCPDDLDVQLAIMECQLNASACDELDRRLRLFEATLEKYDDISHCDLLLLAIMLGSSKRHYGAILLCRAISHRLPENSKHNTWVFTLCYDLFIEMALRMISVVRQYCSSARFVLCSMLRVLKKMKRLKLGFSERADILQADKSIVVCYQTLVYCCNSIGLPESALKFLKALRWYMENLPDDPYFDCVYPDSLINEALSVMTRDDGGNGVDDGLKLLEKAGIAYKTTTNLDEGVRKSRVARIEKMLTDLKRIQKDRKAKNAE